MPAAREYVLRTWRDWATKPLCRSVTCPALTIDEAVFHVSDRNARRWSWAMWHIVETKFVASNELFDNWYTH